MQTLDYCDMEKAAAVQETAPVNLQLAELFQEGAVLQHGKILPVWGWTTPGSTVTAILNGKAARTLYESLGFAEIGIRKGYYKSPAENAVLYKKEL